MRNLVRKMEEDMMRGEKKEEEVELKDVENEMMREE